VNVDQKLAALADRCAAPHLGPEGVCGTCSFARAVTTQIAASDRAVQATLSVCSYRQKLVLPLLDLHEVSNPGVPRSAAGSEAEQVKRAFADAPPEERRAFETLIDTLHAGLR
jgi:hypothetical protein